MTFNKPPEWGARFHFPENAKASVDGFKLTVTEKLACEFAEKYDSFIAEEIAREARAAGVSDLTVLNKAAILEAIERLIDVNALIAYFGEQYNLAMEDPDPVSGYVMSALRCCIEHFKTIPTVDAVEVVRCKDCASYGGTGWCCVHDTCMEENDFCSYGERKDNG